jgi:hypothetical protein
LFRYLMAENADFAKLAVEDRQKLESDFLHTHTVAMERFCGCIEGLCDEWIASDAGAAWISSLQKAKYIPFLSANNF